MSQTGETKFLVSVLRGNEPAVQMCQQLHEIAQVLDDLIDKDKPVSDQKIIHTFWKMLIELPDNPFYRQHELTIRPLIAVALQDWTDSVNMERAGDAHARTLAFVLRDQITAVVVQCACIVGGYEWMQSVSVDIRRYAHEESLEDYLSELKGIPS